MAYGTPSSEEEIVPYYTDILNGRRPSDEMIEELKKRYRAIGASPLAKISKDQAALVQKELERRYPNDTFTVINGYRHIAPMVGDAIEQLVKEQVDAIIGLVLSPQYGKESSQPYHDLAHAKLNELNTDIPYNDVVDWYREPTIIQYWSDQLANCMEKVPDGNFHVIFSAHNVPMDNNEGDVYEEQVKHMGQIIAEKAGIPKDQYSIAWQGGHSQRVKWLEPDIEEATIDLLNRGSKHIISVPIGFISDNLEILYDLDIELKEEIEERGGTLYRLPMPNTDPLLIEALVNPIGNIVEKIASVAGLSPDGRL